MVRYMVVLSLLATLALSGCTVILPSFGNVVTGSGRPVTRQYDFADYTSVDAGNAFRVDISQSNASSISITADDNLFDYIRVSKNGSHLRIGLDPAYQYSLRSGALSAKITMPTLDGVSLSGAARGTITGFKSTTDLRVDLSGAAQLDGDIDAGNTRFNTSGASRATLRGAGKTVAIDGSGASRLDLADWAAQSATVSLSGGSNATVSAASALDYDLSGGSHLTYAGNPSIGRGSTSGGSSATRR